jgi:hypothetical protein
MKFLYGLVGGSILEKAKIYKQAFLTSAKGKGIFI